MDKEELWDTLRNPVLEKSCMNCVHNVIRPCLLFEDHECASPTANINTHPYKSKKWKWNGRKWPGR